MKISVAISPCPNDIFIFAGILKGAVRDPGLSSDVSFHDIEALNDSALTGKYDAVKISAALLPEVGETYELLACGGALGRGCGPLLLSHETKLRGDRPVMLPGEHTTAHFLFNFYCKEKLKKEFLPYDALYEKLIAAKESQGVVIHESRFTYRRDGLCLIRDLGEYWETRTQHPIPLGVVVVRKSLGVSRAVERLIQRSLNWARQNSGEALALCKQYARELSEDVIQSHVKLYVNDFSYDMGEEGRRAIDFMLRPR